MEWNAWHVLGHKITSNETAIYGLVKNIWICKLKNRASGKASCLSKNTLFVATLNHFFVKECSTINKSPPPTHSGSADNFSVWLRQTTEIVFFKEFLYFTNKEPFQRNWKKMRKLKEQKFMYKNPYCNMICNDKKNTINLYVSQ